MVERLRQILEDAILNGATDEQQQRIRDAIAAAERAEAARNRQATASQQNLKQMLQDQAAMGETFAQGYVQQRNEMMAAEREYLERLEELQRQGYVGAEELANQQRALMIQLEQGAAAADSLGDSFDGLMNSMGMNKDLSDSVTGRFLIAGPEGFAAIGARIADTLDVQKLFSSGLVQMEAATRQLFNSFDRSQASLAQNTATTGEYNDMLYQVQEQNRSFNVDVEKAGRAITDLHTEIATFNRMSADQQMMLTETTARMVALGVQTKVGAQQLDNMILGMGMTANMANDASLELVNLGDQIGVAAEVISNDFNKAAGELAKYGPDAINVFKGMAAAAKATGIEVGNLMSVTKQFDTFEGAATSAGKLNAILGGGVLNSMDLLNSTEEERVRLLIQSMSLSGKNFESLNRFEKQAIASAAGIKDMTEANKLFSMSLSAYDDMQASAAGASGEAAKLQERAEAATKFGDKLKQIGQAFAVAFMPVLEFAHGFANIILELNDMTGGMFIPAMLTLVGVVAMFARAQQIANIATWAGTQITVSRAAIETMYGNAVAFTSLVQEGANMRERASIALDLMSIPTRQASAAATVQSGVAAQTASAMMLEFAIALELVAVSAAPLIPAVTAIGFAIGGLGLAIAAPFIALTALIVSFTMLFTAMLEAPQAIGAAIAGLLGFAVAGAAAMVIMALGMAQAVVILIPFAVAMSVVSVPLAQFAAAMAIAAGAFYLLAVGLERLGESLQAFGKVGFDDMQKAAVALLGFTLLMIPLAVPLGVIGLLVGVPLMLIGSGLKSFAAGLAAFNKVGYDDMFKTAFGLTLFTLLMIPLAAPLGVIGLLVGVPLMMLGSGLKSFGEGLAAFNKVGYDDMLKAADGLALFTLLLIPLAVPMAVIGLLVALPLMALSAGLMDFAEGIRAFRKVGIDAMLTAAVSLVLFSGMLIAVSVPLLVASILVAIPLMAIGAGLAEFAMGLRKFNAIGMDTIGVAIASLFFLALGLVAVAVPMILGATLVGIPLMILGLALNEFAVGLQQFNAIGFVEILKMGAALGLLAFVLAGAAPGIALYGLAVALPLAAVSIALGIFGKAMQTFAATDPVKAAAGLGLVFLLGMVMRTSGATLAAYSEPFAYGLTVAAAGLAVFGAALQTFAGVGLGTVFVVIAALLAFAHAMAFLVTTGLIGFMIVGFQLLAIPLAMFGAGLMVMGMGLLLIQAGMPALMSLGDTLAVIAEIGIFGAAVMDMLALSVFGIALALMMIPESKTIAFGFAMQGYAAAMAAVSALTPESVEAAERVVESAAEYAEIQATMRMPDEDSFIQAMKNVFGVGEGKDKQGQDIILELNGRELGRAIDAAINRRHNLAID